MFLSSDDIGEAALGTPKIPDACRHEKDHASDGNCQARPVNVVLATENAPAKAVDDTDDGIEGIEQLKSFGHDVAEESDGRDVKAELDNEGDNKPEIAIFHHQRGNPQSNPEGGGKGEQYEQWQENDVGRRHKTVPERRR